MKKKIYVKRTVKILSLVLALCLFVGFCQSFLLANFDANQARLDGFYLEDDNSLDVVLLGASETYSDFGAGLAYDEFGITSYPYATGANPMSLYLSELKEVLKHQSPQLIVIEINGALYGDDSSYSNEANVRKYVDNMPMSFNKIQTIQENVPLEQQMEFYFPIIKYHGAWNDYPKPTKWVTAKFKTQLRGYSLLKGQSLDTRVESSMDNIIVDKLKNDNSTVDLAPMSEQYLRELLQYCKDENLTNVMFARFPHRVDKKKYDRFQRGNRAGEIISEYGYDFLNLEKDPTMLNLDYSKDFINTDHLNAYGQEKFTKNFGSYIIDKYNITPHQLTDSQKNEWLQSADYTKRFIKLSKQYIDSGKHEMLGEDDKTMERLEKLS